MDKQSVNGSQIDRLRLVIPSYNAHSEQWVTEVSTIKHSIFVFNAFVFKHNHLRTYWLPIDMLMISLAKISYTPTLVPIPMQFTQIFCPAVIVLVQPINNRLIALFPLLVHRLFVSVIVYLCWFVFPLKIIFFLFVPQQYLLISILQLLQSIFISSGVTDNRLYFFV